MEQEKSFLLHSTKAEAHRFQVLLFQDLNKLSDDYKQDLRSAREISYRCPVPRGMSSKRSMPAKSAAMVIPDDKKIQIYERMHGRVDDWAEKYHQEIENLKNLMLMDVKDELYKKSELPASLNISSSSSSSIEVVNISQSSTEEHPHSPLAGTSQSMEIADPVQSNLKRALPLRQTRKRSAESVSPPVKEKLPERTVPKKMLKTSHSDAAKDEKPAEPVMPKKKSRKTICVTALVSDDESAQDVKKAEPWISTRRTRRTTICPSTVTSDSMEKDLAAAEQKMPRKSGKKIPTDSTVVKEPAVSARKSRRTICASTATSSDDVIAKDDIIEKVEKVTVPSHSDDELTPWQPLHAVCDDIPEKSGVYEVKVNKAKRSAYIGHCDNLKDRILAHLDAKMVVQKQVDMFMKRNSQQMEIRYIVADSFADAKEAFKSRLESFKKAYMCLPSYNTAA